MTSRPILRTAAGILLTALMAFGMHRLADSLSGTCEALLLAQDCGGTEPTPNSGQNVKEPPRTPSGSVLVG